MVDEEVAIGVDIGGTNTVIGIVDKDGVVRVRTSITTPDHGNIDQYIDDLTVAIRTLIKKAHGGSGSNGKQDHLKIMGIGIGAPNANYYNGTIEQAPNLSFKGVVPFVDKLKAKFRELDILALTNDANAAAMGEMIYGGAKGMKNFVMYTLGTGVGSGLVVNGDLVYGHDGFAGECGHTTLIAGGRLCGCGAKGHLEAYCSAQGIKRTAFEILARDNAADSLLANRTFQELDSKMIFDAAEKGDKVALEVFEQTGKWLGQGLASTVHHLSPQVIFIFGGPMAAGNYILNPTKQSMEENLLPTFKNKIQIVPSQLKMGDAAIVGASSLVWKELEKAGIHS